MKKVFITGASGFVGSHLAEYLSVIDEFELFGTVFGSGQEIDQWIPKDHQFQLNLMDRDEVIATIKSLQPDWVVHLAALTSPAASFDDPRATFTNNIEAQINVLDGVRQVKTQSRTLIIGSAEEYGKITNDDLPIDEATPLNPMSPYAVSKLAQDFLGLQYHLSYGMDIIRLRPFNHSGERQAPFFVLPTFAKQIAEIEKGIQPPIMKVGNLDAIRDFTDVKDMVRAYVMALEKGKAGEIYNLGSGTGIKIQDLLDTLLSKATCDIKVESDPERMKPSDVPILIADSTKFNKECGWKAEIPFTETVDRVLHYWRQQIA